MQDDRTNGDVRQRQVSQRDDNLSIGSSGTGPAAATGSTTPATSDGATTSVPSSVATIIASPALVTTLILIFGGCCSNVYTLESILALSPTTGTLITFLQFVLTTLYTVRSQLATAGPGHSWQLGLRQRQVPLVKWLVYTAFFLTINILNNAAFGYRISVPLHIILRSAGPATSMLVGYLVGGRRYTSRQIVAVALLFAGVALAAWSDSQSKAPPVSTLNVSKADLSAPTPGISADAGSGFGRQAPGFALLFSALFLSAVMGLYADNMYQQHGRSVEVTSESLFYSHALSLPFFALRPGTLSSQYLSIIASSPATSGATTTPRTHPMSPRLHNPLLDKLGTYLSPRFAHWLAPNYVTPLALLLANAVTQIVCISGVNRLSIQTSSLTVTIVLNIRKLVSLLLSIVLFGNPLPTGVLLGAALVFAGGALYGMPAKRGTKTTASRKQA